MDTSRQPRAFVCYAHKDAAWRKRLLDQKYLDTTLGSLTVWTDACIKPGDRWEADIQAALDQATVAVLFVSPDFFKSSFIRDKELPRIIERESCGELRIVWVPINVDEAKVRKQCKLDTLQAAFGYDRKLPATPDACKPGEVEAIKDQLDQALNRALDPIGYQLNEVLKQRYESLTRIAQTPMTSVYKARDRLLDRDVAVKALRDEAQRDAFVKDVLQAIRTSEHPNFINVYDIADRSGPAYCIVQHVAGNTLAQPLEQCGAMPCQVMVPTFTRIVGAIARAHAMQLSYGNIKPSNIILLDHDDEPFVLPVGRERNPTRDQRRVNDILGRLASGTSHAADTENLAYLVPDHFNGMSVDARLCDQYMLGLLGWHMACGMLPGTVHADRLQPPDPRAFNPLPALSGSSPKLYPERLATLIAKMAHLDPDQRYQDLGQVLTRLKRLGDLDLLLARESYARCAVAPNFDASFFQRFYDEFLDKCEGARRIFELHDGARQKNQQGMLKQALLLLLAYAQQGEEVDAEARSGLGGSINLLSAVAARHAHLDIEEVYFDRFLDALMHVVTGPGGDPWCQKDAGLCKAIEAAWRKALAPGIRYMRSGVG